MVKDKILVWFLRNIYLSRYETIDKSGFIMVSGGRFPLRDIAFPEYIFIEIEKKIKRETIYAVGKSFGYNYALNTDTAVFGNVDKKKFLDGFYFVMRYIESISYGRDLRHTMDYEKRIFEMKAKDYIVCSKNGIGYTLMDGTIGGYCAFAFSDKSIEGVQTKCQGRGDDECELICAPPEILKKRNLKFITSKNIIDLQIDEKYAQINKECETQFSKISLKNLIDSNFLRYDHGTIDYKNERFFLCESSMMYLLEIELKKISGGDKILFDVSFAWGVKLAKECGGEGIMSISSGTPPEKFVSEFMSALGWGDISIFRKFEKYTVLANHFPWTSLSSNISFAMFRGIVSGFLSGLLNKKIMFKKVKKDILSGYFTINLSE